MEPTTMSGTLSMRFRFRTKVSISWPSNLFRRDMEYPAEPFRGHGIALFHQLNGIGECFFTSFEMSEKMRVPFTEVRGSFTFKSWIDQ